MESDIIYNTNVFKVLLFKNLISIVGEFSKNIKL